jgi:hypothetical protein
MIHHPFSKMLTSLLGSEDGELHFAFLLSHTLTNEEAPTLENTKALNAKDNAFKKAYLCEHFSKIEEVLKIVSIIIDSKDKSLLFPYMRLYIKLTGKRFSFWTYLPDKQSFLSHPDAFGNDDFSLSMIDPFRGNQPLLLNNETVAAHKWEISYQPQIILDSQILNYVDWYINAPSKLPGHRLVIVRRLLQYLASNKYFYSPFFYYFESMSNGSNESQLRLTFELIARMHCMGTEAMLRDGSLSFDDGRFSELKSAFTATTFDDLVDSVMTSAREFSDIMGEQIKILSVNNILPFALICAMFPGHESHQIMDYVGRILATGRTAYSATQARKEAQVPATRWGWAKSHGSSENALCHRVCFEDRMPVESFAEGGIRERQFCPQVLPRVEEERCICKALAQGLGGV